MNSWMLDCLVRRKAQAQTTPNVTRCRYASLVSEIAYNVHWDGPYPFKKASKSGKGCVEPGHVLYQLYGTHPLYGPNRLLYIGKTKQGALRFIQHEQWVQFEPNEIEVHLGSVAVFNDWKEWRTGPDVHPKPVASEMKSMVHPIEALLIFSHAPAYNTQNKASANTAKGIRVFNTGRYGMLYPEVSARYMLGS